MPDHIMEIINTKKSYEKSWLAMKNVVAVGLGKTSDGSLGIIISVNKNASQIRKKIPSQIEQINIEIQETGEINALE